jgi:hypothetical protein
MSLLHVGSTNPTHLDILRPIAHPDQPLLTLRKHQDLSLALPYCDTFQIPRSPSFSYICRVQLTGVHCRSRRCIPTLTWRNVHLRSVPDAFCACRSGDPRGMGPVLYIPATHDVAETFLRKLLETVCLARTGLFGTVRVWAGVWAVVEAAIWRR